MQYSELIVLAGVGTKYSGIKEGMALETWELRGLSGLWTDQ